MPLYRIHTIGHYRLDRDPLRASLSQTASMQTCMEPTAVLEVFCNFMPEKPERSLEAFSPPQNTNRNAIG